MKLVKVALAFGVAAAAVLGTADASACMRAMEAPIPKKDDPAHLVAQAEQALESGKLAVAMATVLKKFPALKTALDKERKDGEIDHLENRAVRVVALASVRSGGNYGALGAGKKQQNLDWSVTVLRKMNAARPDDASLQADLGEALARLASGEKEALEILGKLASADLMGSPHAYAALAKLQLAGGDAAKSAESIKRCESMTSTPSICAPAKAVAVPAKTPARPVPVLRPHSV